MGVRYTASAWQVTRGRARKWPQGGGGGGSDGGGDSGGGSGVANAGDGRGICRACYPVP